MGTLGPMSFGPSGHWGQMRTWGKWAPGKINTRANRQLGQMGTLDQMGILGPMDIGASGFSGKMGTRKNKLQSKWALGNWGR